MLDRESKATYTLVLVVSDHGSPPQQSSRIVTVHVGDIDDHKPHFSRALVGIYDSRFDNDTINDVG